MECLQTKRAIGELAQNLDPPEIKTETSSLDTLGNFYFSRGIIADVETVYLVTDAFHMPRSLLCADIVFSNQTRFNPIIAGENKSTFYQRVIEQLNSIVLKKDLADYGVIYGDYHSLSRYMLSAHPFYSTFEPRPSLYRRYVDIFQNKFLAQIFLPTQKQAYKD